MKAETEAAVGGADGEEGRGLVWVEADVMETGFCSGGRDLHVELNSVLKRLFLLSWSNKSTRCTHLSTETAS